jgi:chorismate-pyruvate lyase
MNRQVSISAINRAVRELSSALNSEPSATKVLNRWCVESGFSGQEKSIVAMVKREPWVNPSPELMRDLGIDAGAEVSLRSGHLVCRGPELVLSDINLWWIRERIPEDMRRVLDSTDKPFGEVISALAFKRIPRETEVFQIDEQAENGHEKMEFQDIPHCVIRNTAILVALGKPICFIKESYRRSVLRHIADERLPPEGLVG